MNKHHVDNCCQNLCCQWSKISASKVQLWGGGNSPNLPAFRTRIQRFLKSWLSTSFLHKSHNTHGKRTYSTRYSKKQCHFHSVIRLKLLLIFTYLFLPHQASQRQLHKDRIIYFVTPYYQHPSAVAGAQQLSPQGVESWRKHNENSLICSPKCYFEKTGPWTMTMTIFLSNDSRRVGL